MANYSLDQQDMLARMRQHIADSRAQDAGFQGFADQFQAYQQGQQSPQNQQSQQQYTGTPGVGRRQWNGYVDQGWNYDPLGPFSGTNLAMQGMNAMQSLPGLIGSSFGFVNALNSANKQAYNQTVAPIQMERERREFLAPLLAAIVGGLGGLGGDRGGMTGFADTASRQMASLPTGSSAQPVNYRTR